MKHNILYLIIILTVLACGEEKQLDVASLEFENVLASENMDTLVAKKKELYDEQKKLSDQIKRLNDKISLLDVNSNFPLVTTLETKAENFTHFVELQGNVTTNNLVVITAEYSGLLTDVYVKKGQKVKKGQILAKIDDGGLSQQLTQMQIQADLAKTTYERQARLWEQNIGSEIQFLQAKSNYEAQEEAVKQMKQQIAKATVTAPFSGTIDEIIADEGNNVAPGSQLMRLINLSNMYIEADVPERFIADVTNGKTVEIYFPVLDKSMASKVRQAGNFINAANRTFRIEVDVPEQGGFIKPNLTAKLRINDYSNEQSILIPQNIISENALGQQYVYAIDDIKNQIGKVTRLIIKTGKTQGDVIEVVEGLKPGLNLILEGARSVKQGQTVKVDNF
ncbi:efflux RND transporter periplasmic adaptor subunit [Winogradskyella aurantiaca]|uniref:efflux RND transporter periplasmic adaptor subunit n=1 Tax=Winogradskyella aurantiaca TaxID=2219558 RepID=UPI000E1D24F0|nr:efflux RND transporter periplasmic adaptor subunit [Winogradskyella aurantiaca]